MVSSIYVSDPERELLPVQPPLRATHRNVPTLISDDDAALKLQTKGDYASRLFAAGIEYNKANKKEEAVLDEGCARDEDSIV